MNEKNIIVTLDDIGTVKIKNVKNIDLEIDCPNIEKIHIKSEFEGGFFQKDGKNPRKWYQSVHFWVSIGCYIVGAVLFILGTKILASENMSGALTIGVGLVIAGVGFFTYMMSKAKSDEVIISIVAVAISVVAMVLEIILAVFIKGN